MKSRSLTVTTRTLLSAGLIAGCVAGPALAESPCKGLEQRQCEGKAGCIWVDGYVRKDGVKVAAYCKSSGKSGGTSSTQDKTVASKEKKSSAKETQ